jgi:Domain of unknown function (DUF4124)
MSKWLIVLPMLYATALAAAPAWTWVDENGQRHFSDRPVEGAEQIELAGAQGFSPTPLRVQERAASAESNAAPAQSDVGYTTFDIVSPAHQETLWNIGAVLPVRLAIEPGLQAGHRLDAYLDGARIIIGSTSPQFSVPNVFRGLHTLQAAITDSSGREVLRTQPVTIMVQQTSVQAPN